MAFWGKGNGVLVVGAGNFVLALLIIWEAMGGLRGKRPSPA